MQKPVFFSHTITLAEVAILGVLFLSCKKTEYAGIPKQAVILVKQGDDSLATGRIEGALDLYLKAVDLDSSFSLANAKAAEAYVMAGVRHRATKNMMMKDEMFRQARSYAERAIATKPDDGYAQYVMGLLANENGDTESAIHFFEKADALGISNFILHSTLGYLYNNKMETAKCIEQYLKASSLRPSDEKTLNNLGELYFVVGNHSKSVDYFGQLVRIQPDNMANRVNYAAALWKSGDESKAKELLNQILDSPQGSKFRNYNSVAWVLIDKDVDYEWGIKLATAADEMKRNNIESTDILGWGYFKLKDYKKAVEYLSRSMKMKPSDEVKQRLEMAKEKLAETAK